MSTARKREAFAALHSKPGCFVMPNPWDAGSARFLASLGFPALATSSSAAAMTLGRLDGAISREQVLANAAAIAGATDLPVNGDLMNGFGDTPGAAAETIRLGYEAGLAGGSIEDTRLDGSQPPYAIEVARERIEAAVEAAAGFSEPFAVTARADGLLSGAYDLAEAIRRLQAFEDAGADVLYAPALRSLDEVKSVLSAVGRPVNVLLMNGAEFTCQQLAAAGVRRVSVGGRLYYQALGALRRFAQGLDVEQDAAPGPDPLGFADVRGVFGAVAPGAPDE